ncbi:MAG: hypothetical protein GWQ05_09145 [Verrucomicrobiaceae bacterium]|nr:hypothetical protein [Verrucomicrobiaceae bacterium]
MTSFKNYRFSFLPLATLLAALHWSSGIQIASAEDPFVDEFDGPELEGSWTILDNEGETHIGFNAAGEYEIVDSQSTADAGLARFMSGSGDFTADASVRLENFFDGNVDFKFRFLAPKFMELVFNQNDFMRVFSGERGGNTVTVSGFGYEEGSLMHIRFSWTEADGTMRIGVGLGDEPMQLITTIDGLEGFQPNRADLVLFKIGEGEHTPRLFVDRFEIQDTALPIGIPPFVDDFAGPELAEGWAPLDSEDGATQIGFADGVYEIRDNTEGGDAGLRRPVGGVGSFTANARLTMLDFAGSNTDFKFRFIGTGKFIELVYNSFDDMRVFSQEIGGNIARFNKVGFQDGDVLDLKLAFDSLSGTVQISFAQNGGSMIVLAEETDLLAFTPNNVDMLMFKFGEGNGNAPRMQLDHFEISDGFLPADVQPFMDDFDGPELMPAWTPLGSEADQIGFNEDGQYEIKGAENAGLKLRLPTPGSMTTDLSVKLTDFVDSGSELHMRFPGADAIEIIVNSAGTLSVTSTDKGDLANVGDFSLADGDTLDLRFAWDAEIEELEIGAGVNGEGLELIVGEFDFENLDPRVVEIALSTGDGGGKSPSMLFDKFNVRQGFARVPAERVEPFADDFDGPALSDRWTILHDEAQVGFADGSYQFSDPSRSSDVAGIKTFLLGEGSFTVDAHVTFDLFSGTGSDFKFRFFGGQFIEMVHNSFDDARMHSGEKGAIDRVNSIGIVDGEPVQFRFVWNESLGQAQYGVLIGEGPWKIIGSVAGLTEFMPNEVDMVFFKFGDGEVPQLSVDRFEIRPGVFEMPTDPPIQLFVESFDEQELAEGWTFIDDSAAAQVGLGDGVYELRDPSTSEGNAGIRRGLEGKGGSFTAELALTFDGFAGSNTDFKYRFFGGKFIEIVYNSFDDIRVFSQERGENVNSIQGVGISDGDAVRLRLVWDESASTATIGLAINDNPMEMIASIDGFEEFSPDTVVFVMFKIGEGNGSIPGMLLDQFDIAPGVFPITPPLPPVESYEDTFDGPDLAEGWNVRDDSAEAQIGFTENGQYQVNEPSTSENGDAGVQRAFTSGGSFTADLEMQFEDFSGSNTDFKFRFFGGKFIELVYNSFDDVRVFSGEKGENVNRINGIGITDSTPLHFRFIWDADTGNATFGVAIADGSLIEIATAEGLMEFTPNSVDFVMFKFGEGNGNTPKMLIDRFEIRPGVFPLPAPPAEGFVETFDGPDLAEIWTLRDDTAEAQIGFTENGQYQVNEPSTSENGDAGISRPIMTNGGSFTADLEMQFEDFNGSNTDFKFRFFGGQFIELVYNSFDDVRVFSGEKGENVNRINGIGITDSTPLHFRFVWDAESGNATYGVSIDRGAMIEIATAESLMEFTPNTVDFVMFKFGEGNGNTPKMLIDRFEIRPGAFPLDEGGGGDGPAIQITSIDVTGDAARTSTITWSSAVDTTYDVEWSENLIDWNVLAEGIESAGEETTVSDADIPADVPQRYYRVR